MGHPDRGFGAGAPVCRNVFGLAPKQASVFVHFPAPRRARALALLRTLLASNGAGVRGEGAPPRDSGEDEEWGRLDQTPINKHLSMPERQGIRRLKQRKVPANKERMLDYHISHRLLCCEPDVVCRPSSLQTLLRAVL